jgi:hypothetical protein
MSPQRLRSPRLAARLAAALVGAVAVTTLAAMPSASAAPMTARLSIGPTAYQYGCANMRAVIPTDQYDTWGYLYNGAHARVQLWGDDPVWDDLRFTSGWAYLNAGVDGVAITGTSEGIVVTWTKCAGRVLSIFDEDAMADSELYVTVRVIDGDGYTLASAKSNVVSIGVYWL